MRRFAVAILFFVAGCATEEQVKQYESDSRNWAQDNQSSQQSWGSATGGSWNGPGTSIPRPKDPRWPF